MQEGDVVEGDVEDINEGQSSFRLCAGNCGVQSSERKVGEILEWLGRVGEVVCAL